MDSSQQTPFRFSKEEIRVLQECNRESFYRRCLPFSTVLGVGTYMAVKSGYLKPHSKYGAIPKVAAAVAIGFIAGKISYQQTCAEKLMTIPNSRLSAALRHRSGGPKEITLEGSSELEKIVKDTTDSQKYSDVPKNSSMDLDTDRPMSGFDDSYRPTDGSYLDDTNSPLLPPPGQTSATYEELRRRNREEYELKRTKPYRGVVTPEDVPTGLRPPSSGDFRRFDHQSNVYGDVWEK